MASAIHRSTAWLGLAALTLAAGCRIGEHIAEAPIDGPPGAIDAGLGTDAPTDAPPGPRGLRATIGERPEVTGSCSALDDRAEMEDRFDPAVAEADVTAGWEFDTDADSYDDASYGFQPPWPAAQSGRFSVRFSGLVHLEAGTHCFSIDIGATGTDIIGGKNACGQLWVGTGSTALAETGFDASSGGPATGCVDTASAGPIDLDIVFWYFNIFERARLTVRHCVGGGCTPAEPLVLEGLEPR